MLHHLPQWFSPSRVEVRTSVCALLLFFLFSGRLFAQADFKPREGQIDRKSLEMTAYAADSTADAIVLYDYGDVSFDYNENIGILMTLKYRVRIKILKESALERASVTIPYGESGNYVRDESVYDISGYTYNLVGDKVETTQLTKKGIVNAKISDSYYVCKFNLQNVRKGSVIEYSYTKKTPLNFQDKPDTWNFQSSVPSQWSEYNITIPYVLYYKISMAGYIPLYINKREVVPVNVGHPQLDGNGMSYRFVVKDAPAFSNESFITTPEDYLSKISFELSSVTIPGQQVKNYSQSWKNVDETLLSMSGFGGQLKSFSFIKEIKQEIAGKTADPAEKMKLAYAYVQENIKWNGKTGFSSKDGVKKAFENKKGNAGDINLMLTDLLRELELEANPVVLSTRSNGKVYESIPLLEGFNYIVCHVKLGSKTILLDATQRNNGAGMLPEFALSGTGRLVPDKGEGSFIDLTPKVLLGKLERIEAAISPADGTLKGSYFTSLTGYEALRWRDNYVNEADNAYGTALKKQNPEWEIENFRIINKKQKLDEAVEISYDFNIESDEASPEIFYFNPMLKGRITENPFKALTRIYPIDLKTGISTSFMANYTVPEGYYLEEIPKVEILTLPDKAGKFAYQIKQTDNVISVHSVVMINKPCFSAEEYDFLREFYDRIVQKHGQPLVLKKRK